MADANVEALRYSVTRLRDLSSEMSDDGVIRLAYPSEWSIADVLSHPHVAERGNVVTASDASFGELGMIGPLPVLSRTPGCVRTTGPALGEHTQEILASRLGYAPDEIHALHEAGVI